MKIKPILPHPIMYLVVYEAKRQIQDSDVMRILYSEGYESPIRLGKYNWAMYNKKDNAEYHFDRYDAVQEYEYINKLALVGDIEDLVGKDQIEKWEEMKE